MASKRYPVPFEEVRREIVVVNSRFIATLAPVFSVEEARGFIQRIRSEFPDASHHVPAFLVGFGESVTAHCSDAGEPAGTAGRPALAVLQGSGMGDAAVVVTRYFGGTKLGTGGLVQAYSEAVREVLRAVRRAERVPTHTVMVEVPYALLERLRRLVPACQGVELDVDFTTSVLATLRFPQERLAEFQAALSELSNGSAQVVLMETSQVIMPLPQSV